MIENTGTPTREERSIPKDDDVLDSKNDLRVLKSNVDRNTSDIGDLKHSVDKLVDKVDDIEEDIELIDRANRESSESKRNLRDNVIVCLVGGLITALFGFLGNFLN